VIVLDTNVVSELMRPNPDATVIAWLRRQPPHQLATTAVTVAELQFGIARLPKGRRSTTLARKLSQTLGAFPEQILAFEAQAAAAYGTIAAAHEKTGWPMAALDAEIAAICHVRSAMLATRNVKDFDGCGVTTINPWTER
jgi:predicted nucleic acid-binding protein